MHNNAHHTTHAKNRCSTKEDASKMLEGMKPSQVMKQLKCDTSAPISINNAIAALIESHGIDAAAVFISNLWVKKPNAGERSIERELNADWINKQL